MYIKLEIITNYREKIGNNTFVICILVSLTVKVLLRCYCCLQRNLGWQYFKDIIIIYLFICGILHGLLMSSGWKFYLLFTENKKYGRRIDQGNPPFPHAPNVFLLGKSAVF